MAAASQWLNAKAIAGKIDDLIIIADPKTLDEMRRHYHKELEKRLASELDKALAGEPIDKVEKLLAAACLRLEQVDAKEICSTRRHFSAVHRVAIVSLWHVKQSISMFLAW